MKGDNEKLFFHEAVTPEKFRELCEQGITWGELKEMYKQPDWCMYKDALYGPMGCWSLLGFRVTGVEFCKECELCKEYVQK